MPDIFEPRQNLKPREYPELTAYKDAIRKAYWVHTEFDSQYNADVQDYRTRCTEAEQIVIKRTMLAISQIEVSVKRFWADIYQYMPKPEVDAVGVTFSESEARHADAYAHLLQKLGLDEEFEQIKDQPAIQDRIDYLEDALKPGDFENDNRNYVKNVLLFSLFIEHISLFSQFLIMLSFDKHNKRFKGIANAVEATSKEEQIHGLFGAEIINIVREERPEWFDEDFAQQIEEAAYKAFRAEMKVLDWIFEKGELDFLPRDVINTFLKDKFNSSLERVDFDPIFEVDEDLLQETQWFYEDILMTKGNDFFSKRGTSYMKGSSVTEDDLF